MTKEEIIKEIIFNKIGSWDFEDFCDYVEKDMTKYYSDYNLEELKGILENEE
jgi:hypothetical protein